MQNRMESQGEERIRAKAQIEQQRVERPQQERGTAGAPEQVAYPGAFMVSHDKPAPKLDTKMRDMH